MCLDCKRPRRTCRPPATTALHGCFLSREAMCKDTSADAPAATSMSNDKSSGVAAMAAHMVAHTATAVMVMRHVRRRAIVVACSHAWIVKQMTNNPWQAMTALLVIALQSTDTQTPVQAAAAAATPELAMPVQQQQQQRDGQAVSPHASLAAYLRRSLLHGGDHTRTDNGDYAEGSDGGGGGGARDGGATHGQTTGFDGVSSSPARMPVHDAHIHRAAATRASSSTAHRNGNSRVEHLWQQRSGNGGADAGLRRSSSDARLSSGVADLLARMPLAGDDVNAADNAVTSAPHSAQASYRRRGVPVTEQPRPSTTGTTTTTTPAAALAPLPSSFPLASNGSGTGILALLTEGQQQQQHHHQHHHEQQQQQQSWHGQASATSHGAPFSFAMHRRGTHQQQQQRGPGTLSQHSSPEGSDFTKTRSVGTIASSEHGGDGEDIRRWRRRFAPPRVPDAPDAPDAGDDDDDDDDDNGGAVEDLGHRDGCHETNIRDRRNHCEGSSGDMEAVGLEDGQDDDGRTAAQTDLDSSLHLSDLSVNDPEESSHYHRHHHHQHQHRPYRTLRGAHTSDDDGGDDGDDDDGSGGEGVGQHSHDGEGGGVRGGDGDDYGRQNSGDRANQSRRAAVHDRNSHQRGATHVNGRRRHGDGRGTGEHMQGEQETLVRQPLSPGQTLRASHLHAPLTLQTLTPDHDDDDVTPYGVDGHQDGMAQHATGRQHARSHVRARPLASRSSVNERGGHTPGPAVATTADGEDGSGRLDAHAHIFSADHPLLSSTGRKLAPTAFADVARVGARSREDDGSAGGGSDGDDGDDGDDGGDGGDGGGYGDEDIHSEHHAMVMARAAFLGVGSSNDRQSRGTSSTRTDGVDSGRLAGSLQDLPLPNIDGRGGGRGGGRRHHRNDDDDDEGDVAVREEDEHRRRQAKEEEDGRTAPNPARMQHGHTQNEARATAHSENSNGDGASGTGRWVQSRQEMHDHRQHQQEGQWWLEQAHVSNHDPKLSPLPSLLSSSPDTVHPSRAVALGASLTEAANNNRSATSTHNSNSHTSHTSHTGHNGVLGMAPWPAHHGGSSLVLTGGGDERSGVAALPPASLREQAAAVRGGGSDSADCSAGRGGWRMRAGHSPQ
ncbi:hypothetical protein PTSG_12626 [Salpingoeca rosetta]|uniref:Uncharacterized protein n=1 Tax=Salpingoeca rosetta (strain ATCC 50818 / BSB-021) TaxID=946362 RepID=F2UHK7_SALR5|nr:uncharacterized protein PTSG_12626 [Salpingoeca rosetta]EGD76606.1 hypothetical protein PTSG_12626 [Salpingoeca rosetta]|eukprot:XP_004991520.1 hypothetical protein PTSG_12626 [Salpingoeca rosetta]